MNENIQTEIALEEAWKPAAPRWLIAAAVMLSTFMEVLDSSVANVSLPHIAGSLSATVDESTWVLTSYLVSNAVILPATGWFSRVFGRKRLLLGCLFIFTITSCLCGLATNLGFLIVTRILQGIGGGALQPISQAIMLESFPQNKRGQAMGIFALGVIVAPIVGPTLGGWITDNYSWRWIFLINLPVGVLSLFMVNSFIEDPPYLKRLGRPEKVDTWGLFLMIVWIASLQIILDKGQQVDWFESNWVATFSMVCAVTLVIFIVHELRTEHPIVNLRIFANRNFAVGTALMAVTGGVLYGSTVLLPVYLQNLMGYTALLSGLVISPRGVGAFVTSMFVGRIAGRFDDRVLIAIGFLGLAFTNYLWGNINLDISFANIVPPVLLNGVAMAFIFVPLTTITMGTLKNEHLGNATGIFNLVRNLGGGIGISVLITLLSRHTQMHQAILTSHLTVFDPAYRYSFQTMTQALATKMPASLAHQGAQEMIYHELTRQSSLLAFVDNFHGMALACLACTTLVFLFKRVKRGKAVACVH